MRTSIFIAAASAALALAGPVEKRKYVTTVQVHYETVTVTEGAEPAKPTAEQLPQPSTYEVVAPEPTTEAPEPTTEVPEPTTEAPEVVVITTYMGQPEPEPEPTTPVVTVVEPPAEPTKEPEPEPTIEEASVPPSSVAASQPTAPADDDFEGTAIYHHNLHRYNHSSPAVEWDSEIAGYASNTAATCVFAHDMDQGSGNYGQNIAMWATSSGAEDLGAAGAIKMATTDMWYNGEFSKYLPSYYGQDTPDMSNFEAWGHLTQLVWKSSTRLGCAVQFCPRGSMSSDMDAWYMVCNYGPPGNVGGAYATNVLAPLGEATVNGV
ncbi:hypothetical protein DL764_000138 [Monosporascus ibericus]|uniref:SCP domain-containing protein n=1 Tax=Monosporascus ibericus TaxID=155417 RepID=A0A4Q4U006_9PEZI|nr:hypothetical protein DL764_000138 [Monosporascus ibericus]